MQELSESWDLSIMACQYDALTAHAALVFTRYMLMSLAKRNDEDERTLGELFYFHGG